MANENKIREAGLANATRIRMMDGDTTANIDEESVDAERLKSTSTSNLQSLAFTEDYMAADTVGRKLPGVPAATIRVPQQFRHCMLRINEQSAVVRHWEDQLIAQGPRSMSTKSIGQSIPVLSSRMFYSRARAYPVGIFSVIKYDAGEEKARRAKLRAEDKKGLEVFDLPKRDWRGFSYKPLFRPLAEERATDYYYERGYMYDPNALVRVLTTILYLEYIFYARHILTIFEPNSMQTKLCNHLAFAFYIYYCPIALCVL
jgi:hypothetical protein